LLLQERVMRQIDGNYVLEMSGISSNLSDIFPPETLKTKNSWYKL